ncbi:MAG: hypothetical protein U0234_32340 [Sandaracinus sp.]
MHARPTMLAALALMACTTSPPPTTTESDAGMDASEIDAPSVDAATVDAWVPPVPSTPIDAANAVTASDPHFEGQQRFLYDTWGAERFDTWPPADFMLALMTDEPAVFGNQYESFGFLPDPDDDFPIGFRRGTEDATRVHETCALCHVGRLADGPLWLGLPNTRLDFSRFRYEVDQRWVAAGHPSMLSASDVAKALAYGPGRTGADSADYPGAVPADFPPYFFLGERTAMNYLGTGGNVRTEVFLSLFAFGVGDPTVASPIDFPPAARTTPFVEFMGSMQSPPAPSQDPAMVAAGAAIFTREHCADCHHVDDISMNGVTTYDHATDGHDRLPGEDPAFPHGSIHTDYLHRILVDGPPPTDAGVTADAGPNDAGPTSDPGRAALLMFIGRNRLAVRLSDGYRVDDLHGLWATAPYLHNGSVPTLDDLLRPAAMRPTTFMRGDFLVDTTLPANGNGGHEFGTTISDTDRAALVAYLLSL